MINYIDFDHPQNKDSIYQYVIIYLSSFKLKRRNTQKKTHL